jgi:hypothetical protein
MPIVALEPEMMDMDEPAEPEMAAEHDEAAKQEEEKRSSQMKKKNMKRRSPSELQIFMLYRIHWRTSNFRFRINRKMHARIGSRPKTCCGPF